MIAAAVGSGQGDNLALNFMNTPIQPIWRRDKPPQRSTATAAHTAVAPAPGVFCGREHLRVAVQSRLLPALRAHQPDLILISAGFDGAAGDVGNVRIPTRC